MFSILASSGARAQNDTAAAARAFEEGQRAQLRGDHAQAAQLFELAHRAAPAPAALRSAIRSHRSAGNDARAATLSLRAQREYPDDADTAGLAASTISEVAAELTRLDVTCSEPCTLTTDSRLVSLEESDSHALYLRPGSHELLARFGDRTVSRSLTAQAGTALEERFDAPAVVETEPEPEPEPVEPDPEPMNAEQEPVTREPESSGLPPALTFIGLGVTAALGAVMVWSLVDTFSGSDKYEADPTREGWEDGQDRIRRTWILGMSTAVVGLATIVLAAVGTDWGGDDELDDTRVRVVPSVGRGAGGLFLEGTF